MLFKLRHSVNHFTFTTNAISTSGKPSGGLACIIKKISFFSPSCYFSSEYLLVIRLGKTVLINIFMPHDEMNMTSLNKFSKEFASLKTLPHRIRKDACE